MKSLQSINIRTGKIPVYHSCKCCLPTLILVLIMLVCSGCDKYKRTERIEGMYYPNGTVQLWCFVDETPKARYVTFNQPTRVTEIGIKKLGWGWGPSTGKEVEVAKLELSGKTVYTHIEFLYNYGHFEYQERSATLKESIQDHPIISVLLVIVLSIVVIIGLYKKFYPTTALEYSSGSYSSSSYAWAERTENSSNNSEQERTKEKKIIGHAGHGKRVNPKTGVIQEEGLTGWVDTGKRIDPETGNYQTEGFIDWKDTETRIDQETGIIQKEGFIDYIDTDTRINPETGIIQKKGLLGWVDTDRRIDPETGKSQYKGFLGWVDD